MLFEEELALAVVFSAVVLVPFEPEEVLALLEEEVLVLLDD